MLRDWQRDIRPMFGSKIGPIYVPVLIRHWSATSVQCYLPVSGRHWFPTLTRYLKKINLYIHFEIYYFFYITFVSLDAAYDGFLPEN